MSISCLWQHRRLSAGKNCVKTTVSICYHLSSTGLWFKLCFPLFSVLCWSLSCQQPWEGSCKSTNIWHTSSLLWSELLKRLRTRSVQCMFEFWVSGVLRICGLRGAKICWRPSWNHWELMNFGQAQITLWPDCLDQDNSVQYGFFLAILVRDCPLSCQFPWVVPWVCLNKCNTERVICKTEP